MSIDQVLTMLATVVTQIIGYGVLAAKIDRLNEDHLKLRERVAVLEARVKGP